MSCENIELSFEEELKIIAVLEKCGVPEETLNQVKTVFTGFRKVAEEFLKKKGMVLKLLRSFFGKKTEKAPKKEGSKPETEKTEKSSGRKKGNTPISAYGNAEKKYVEHKDLTSKDTCPDCGSGPVYKMKEPKLHLNISAVSPFYATIYECEKLRCSVCGKVFTAPLPEEASKDKYDESAGAMLALLKYGFGMPSKRLETFLGNMNFPFSDSTQWDVLLKTADTLLMFYKRLFFLGANGNILHFDDTPAKVLSLMKEIQEKEDPGRTGMYTTAFVSKKDGREIAIFMTGANYAGENLSALLEKRTEDFDYLILMCDALSRNIPPGALLQIAYCLIHGRRHFIDVEGSFPDEVSYVLGKFQEIYKNEENAKKLSPDERLIYHQKHSKPHIYELYGWFRHMINDHIVESGSGLGSAIKYMLNHEEKLTAFLRIPGAPIDNNDCERIIKTPVRYRKNSYFYKNTLGAMVADIFMSIIKTCDLNKVNPFDYLVTIHKNFAKAKENCDKWMPWNYLETLQKLQL